MTNNIFLAVALNLIEQNGQTTTLEIKNELRKIPNFQVFQSDVSDAVQQLVDDNELIITGDNGLYRTYSVLKDRKVTKEQLAKLVIDNLNTSMYLEFKTKNSGGGLKKATLTPETYSILGFVTSGGMKVYLNRIKLAKINNVTYTI